jgi:cobalt transporter subunit CbtA
MFRRIFATALIAGLLGGLGISVVQEYTTTPIIIHAEQFEGGKTGDPHKHSLPHRGLKLISPALAHSDGPKKADSDEGAWAPGGGVERTLFTTVANVLTGSGFALIMVACFAIAGQPVNGRTGVLWGLAGFGIISLAPALGLPPEVPGAMEAELSGRQAWWFFCVAATAAGLWCMVFRKGAPWVLAGILLIALPHLIGAPQPERVGGPVPPEIAAHFVAASLFTAAVFWSVTGWLAGTFWMRFAPEK